MIEQALIKDKAIVVKTIRPIEKGEQQIKNYISIFAKITGPSPTMTIG